MDKLIVASHRRLADYAKVIKEGLALSSSARGTSTYYHSKEAQVKAVRNKVNEFYQIDKSLPLLLASLDDSNFFFRQEVLRKELSGGFYGGPQHIVNLQKWLDGGLLLRMVEHIINSMPITYTLRLFDSFSKKGTRINNSRTRRILAHWVLGNVTDFTVVKYRNKMRRILRHALGSSEYDSLIHGVYGYLANEPVRGDIHKYLALNEARFEDTAKLIAFMAGMGNPEWYGDMRFTKAYYATCNAINEETFYKAAENLEYHMVTGILSTYQNPVFTTFYAADGKLKESVKKRLLKDNKTASDDQKVRTKALQERVGGDSRKDINYGKVSTETLYKTQGIAQEQMIRVEQDMIKLPYKHVGIIEDCSLSNRGGVDSANTPAVIINHLAQVLSHSIPSYLVRTGLNQTDLSGPFIQIMGEVPDTEAVFVLSDGYENFPYEGCLNDLVGKVGIPVIHLSPYVSSEMKAEARSLGGNIITMAVNKPSQIVTQMEARLLDFDPTAYFEKQFSRFLEN